jgi:hypothetical protein
LTARWIPPASTEWSTPPHPRATRSSPLPCMSTHHRWRHRRCLMAHLSSGTSAPRSAGLPPRQRSRAQTPSPSRVIPRALLDHLSDPHPTSPWCGKCPSPADHSRSNHPTFRSWRPRRCKQAREPRSTADGRMPLLVLRQPRGPLLHRPSPPRVSAASRSPRHRDWISPSVDPQLE